MTYLFAISVVAFVALMWASISTARHIRRARRRRSMAKPMVAHRVPTFSPEASAAAESLAAGTWGRSSRPDWKSSSQTPVPPPPAPEHSGSFIPASPIAIDLPFAPRQASEFMLASEPSAAAPEPPPSPITPRPATLSELRFPLSSQRRASSAAIAIANEAASHPNSEPAASLAPDPLIANSDSAASVLAATKFQLRHPPAPVSSDSRTDWAYFNKDMGDLRDPEPRFRERHRHR